MAKRQKTKIDVQGDLPGVKTGKIDEIETLARELAEVRGDRMRLTRDESDLAGRLVEQMKSNKLDFYECKTFTGNVRIKHGSDKVSVKLPKEDGDDDD